MGCGCGEGLGDRLAQILGIDGFGGELPHGPAQQQCLAPTTFEGLLGAEPEQVVLAAADQARAVDPSSGRSSPRTTATGTPPSLPLTRSPAAAISSATATDVTCSSLPCESCEPA